MADAPKEIGQPVKRYFRTSTWIDKPTEVGCLSVDNYDPTYGDGGVGLGSQVFECLVCGTVVFNVETHIRWHEEAGDE